MRSGSVARLRERQRRPGAAGHQASEARERTAAEAAALLERVEPVSGKMLARARGVEAELDGLVSGDGIEPSSGGLLRRAGFEDRVGIRIIRA
jgi:hypothetical protein